MGELAKIEWSLLIIIIIYAYAEFFAQISQNLSIWVKN